MTSETFAFTDTAETISGNPAGIAAQEAAGRAYAAYGADLAEDARAILHSLRRRLTGREIDHCEAAAGLRHDIEAIYTDLIDRIRNQFPREIAEAKAAMWR